MRLHMYYKYTYKFDILSKYNYLIKSQKFFFLKKNIEFKTYSEFILLEFALSQHFCLLKSTITLRKLRYWFFLENCLSALCTNIKCSINLFIYLQNIFLFKNLQLQREILNVLIKSLIL